MAAGMDEDTAQAVQSGRETLGALLAGAQRRLQRVFIVFAAGLVGTILAMRNVVWPELKRDLLAEGAEVIAQTPFDVILLQVKIGFIVGFLVAVPALLYYSRDPLRERGVIRDVPVSRWKAAVVAVLSLALFVGGTLYAYYLFFPIMFRFLAENAQLAGFATRYSIVMWTEFILVLALSFGLAAQLPLVMTALSYSGVVPYEAFRDYWKHAVLGMWVFGALFSPPDPFTQTMWALPLVVLYGFSLYLSKVLVTAKRGSDSVDLRGVVLGRWNHIAGVALVGGALGYLAFDAGLLAGFNRVLALVGSSYRFGVAGTFGLPYGRALLVYAGATALLAGLLATSYVVYRAVEAAAERERRTALFGDPAAMDVGDLSVAGIQAAPEEAFRSLEEDELLRLASEAMDADDPEKAQALLDRYDAAHAGDGDAAGDDGAGGAGADGAEVVGEGEETIQSTPFSRTSAGVLDAFTEEETTEEDVGGYYHDLRFIVDSLRSRLFRIAAVFLLVLGSTFTFLYAGGIGTIREDFLSRLPTAVTEATPLDIITLHPVEALVFEVKVSTLFAVIVTLPVLLYYAWPALVERGLVTGDRGAIVLWGGAMLAGLLGGLVVGYLYVAPSIVSWLVSDANQANMVIAYRMKSFFWLVFLTTAGIGILADVPVSMLLFHFTGLVSYATMREHWRAVTVGVFALSALLTPDSLYTMLVIAVPLVGVYFLGLALLWVATLGGRRGGRGRPVPE